jgi:4-amino-4-deoxy-L-arabinose transferase-like glycosyltransferase
MDDLLSLRPPEGPSLSPTSEPRRFRVLWTRRHALALALILLCGALVRIALHGGVDYSPADETTYLDYASMVQKEGLEAWPALVEEFEAAGRGIPSPVRWGYVLTAAGACGVAGECTYDVLAWLSTLSGIAVIALVYMLGAATVGRGAGLLAAALVALSPLQLAMGRRALQDEVVCAATLLALLVIRRMAAEDADSRRYLPLLLSAGAVSLSMVIKETTLLFYPAFLILAWPEVARRGIPWRLAVPLMVAPLVLVGGYLLLMAGSGDGAGALVGRMVGAQAGVGLAPPEGSYTAKYHGGSPHRLLIDLLALNPFVVILALGAVAHAVVGSTGRARSGERRILLATVASALLFAALPNRNARLWVPLDALFAILAAHYLLTVLRTRIQHRVMIRWGVAGAAALAIGAVNALIFRRVFLEMGVYDPVTDRILWALGMIP